jgi:hypothetical protein
VVHDVFVEEEHQDPVVELVRVHLKVMMQMSMNFMTLRRKSLQWWRRHCPLFLCLHLFLLQ